MVPKLGVLTEGGVGSHIQATKRVWNGAQGKAAAAAPHPEEPDKVIFKKSDKCTKCDFLEVR